ncbi:MAG: hypothetical protein AAB674_02895 [Patescibacteria group bacterium]
MNLLSKNRVKLSIAAVFITGLFFNLSPASAQELLKNTLGEIYGKIEKIDKIQENQILSNEEKDIQETEARKDALLKILEITISENNDLKDKLESFNNLPENEQKIKEALIKSLEENLSAYQVIENRLAEIETAIQAKQLASDFKNWRALVYNPKTEKITAFISVLRQKEAVETAKGRLQNIEKNIEKIETAKIFKKGDSEEILKKAADGIENAEIMNDKAEKMIVEILNQELFQKNGFLNKLAIKNIFAKEKTTPTAVRQYVGDSLKQLQITYQIFLDISRLAKEKIGLK